MSDSINPDHYKVGGIETIEILEAKLSHDEFVGYLKGNVLKYITRASHKNGIEDLRKAYWYLDRLIGECYEETPVEQAPVEEEDTSMHYSADAEARWIKEGSKSLLGYKGFGRCDEEIW